MKGEKSIQGRLSDVRVTKGYANSWISKKPCKCYGAVKLLIVILVVAVALAALPLAIAVGNSIYEEGQRTHLPPPTKFHPRLIRPEVRTNLVEEATWNLTSKISFYS